MADEATIQAELESRFPFLQGKVRVARARRLFAEVPYDRFPEVFDHVIRRMGFTMLCTITGLDLGTSLGAIYHMAQEKGCMLNLQTSVPKDRPVLRSVSAVFPAAEMYERELVDLLGFQVEQLPEGSRYPLPDNWPAGQHPLRKDWKPQGAAPGAPAEKESPNG